MSAEFEAFCARRGRPSVPPEMLLKALLLQILFSIRSERLLVEAIDYNLLYRWFVGLNIEDKVWDHSNFSANRERPFNEELARVFFERVKYTAEWAKLIGNEHFSVDGTLIEAWAEPLSFKRNARRLIVGADKGYDCRAFVQGCRQLGISPHVAAKAKHSAIDGRTRRHKGYPVSLKVRKRIEAAFGWIKTAGGSAKTKLIGHAKLAGQALMCFAAYNLARMGCIGGWWDAHHV